MGKTVTPKYALEIFTNKLVNGKWTSVPAIDCATWDIKSHGRPTAENLEKYVLAYAKSLEAGGINEGISKDLGYIPYPTKAVIRYNHAHGAEVAVWKAAAFQVW
jgi:hypothetical protein